MQTKFDVNSKVLTPQATQPGIKMRKEREGGEEGGEGGERGERGTSSFTLANPLSNS